MQPAEARALHGTRVDRLDSVLPPLDAGSGRARRAALCTRVRRYPRRWPVMRRNQPTDLGRELVRFFEDYLPAQRGMSPHTIHSYRDALLLLLQFASRDTNRGIERLTINDLSVERV